MKKIAFFVEGQTERIFIEKFLDEYFSTFQIERTSQKYLGKNGVKFIGERKNPFAKFYILIFDVAGDGNITSVLKDRAENMIVNSGYSYILALRDLYPFLKEDKNKIIEAFGKIFNPYPFKNKLKLILAIMEIEAWFLADNSLFERINSTLTHILINEKLGIDLINDNPESYPHPSVIIDNIFQLFNKRYKKREGDTYKIVYNLDLSSLCCSQDILTKIKSWKYFLDCVNESFI